MAAAASAGSAGAAEKKTSFGVSAMVIATCRIAPGQGQGCTQSAKPGVPTIPPPQPLVTYSRDPTTGATIETVEF
jgi:hypothetical protein